MKLTGMSYVRKVFNDKLLAARAVRHHARKAASFSWVVDSPLRTSITELPTYRTEGKAIAAAVEAAKAREVLLKLHPGAVDDKAAILGGRFPYMWIGRRQKPEKPSYENASHFELIDSRRGVFCTHGAWPGVLVFDALGRFRGLEIEPPGGATETLLMGWWEASWGRK